MKIGLKKFPLGDLTNIETCLCVWGGGDSTDLQQVEVLPVDYNSLLYVIPCLCPQVFIKI